MWVVVGRIGRSHGIRGEVSVDPRTDEPAERFAVGAAVRADGRHPRRLTIKSVRPHSGRLLVAFDEVVDRTQADTLQGATLSAEVAVDQMPADPEEFYDRQLIGLEVYLAGGGRAGNVVGVLHSPLQDLLTIRRPDGREVMVPFVAELVPQIDLVAGIVRVADRPGLLDPDDAGATDLPVSGDG
jgi:16S rRNA processing protein RimM